MNILDVARNAHVSPATVSRVLNGFARVSPETRARVLAAIESLHYHPNANARALSQHANRTLGVIVSNLDNPYFLDVYRAFEERALGEGYELLVANTNYAPERLASSFAMMLSRRVAGLAAVVSEMDDEVAARLLNAGIPVAISGVEARRRRVASIRVDCRSAMHALVEHLRRLGHRSVAFVDHHAGLETIGERRRAFLESLPSPAAVVSVSDSFAGGREAARIVLALPFRPTAVVCVNDQIAVGVLKELDAAGVRVPEHVSVTGFDNIALSGYVKPALTTVDIPRTRIGSLLFDQLTLGDAVREIAIEPQLVVRESTARAAKVAQHGGKRRRAN